MNPNRGDRRLGASGRSRRAEQQNHDDYSRDANNRDLERGLDDGSPYPAQSAPRTPGRDGAGQYFPQGAVPHPSSSQMRPRQGQWDLRGQRPPQNYSPQGYSPQGYPPRGHPQGYPPQQGEYRPAYAPDQRSMPPGYQGRGPSGPPVNYVPQDPVALSPYDTQRPIIQNFHYIPPPPAGSPAHETIMAEMRRNQRVRPLPQNPNAYSPNNYHY